MFHWCTLYILNRFLCCCFISWNSEDRPWRENRSLIECYFEIWIQYLTCSCRTYSQFNSNFNLHDIDLLEAVTEAKIVIRRLADERNNVHVWEALFDKACEVASEFEMEASRPRVVVRQRNRANYSVDNPSDWRISIYLAFLDHLV
jgi:hypothetical protein